MINGKPVGRKYVVTRGNSLSETKARALKTNRVWNSGASRNHKAGKEKYSSVLVSVKRVGIKRKTSKPRSKPQFSNWFMNS